MRNISPMRIRRMVVLACAALVTAVVPGAASPLGTNCNFGGPTPGWRAMRLDLPNGSDFLTLELGGQRTTRPVADDANWHLAQGIYVLNADSLAIEAYRIDSAGMAPRRAVVRDGGPVDANQAIVAPDVPYEHHGARLRSGLAPGRYLVVAFGADGGSALQNEWWSAGLQVAGTHSCATTGSGEVFDFDHTDFTGGTMLYAPGVGHAEGATLAFQRQRQLVVGLLDAETQGRAASTVSLDYQMPTHSGTLSQALIPFVSTGGDYRFEASFTGYYPVVVVAGVSLTVS